MNSLNLTNTSKVMFRFLVLVALAFALSRTKNATAQSSSSAPSGTYVCLTNSNMSGYISQQTGDATGSFGINQMFTLSFNPATPTQVTTVGLVANTISNYENGNKVSTTTSAKQPNVVATLTANTPAPYIYKMVASSGGVTDYYIGVVNGGNTLFFMSAPTNTSTMNGACQKV